MKSNRVESFFSTVVKYPKLILSICLLAIIGIGSQIPNMKIDTSIEAFIPQGHHSLENRELVRETFGLSDPIVIAVTNDSPNGVFTPGLLNLVAELSDKVAQVEGVDPEKITSLSTENNIFGLEDEMIVEPFIEQEVTTNEKAKQIKKSVLDFPLYVGNLVSEDASTTLIVIELLDKSKYAKEAFFEIKKLSEEVAASKLPKISDKAQILVAGEGGVVAYQAAYIDQDAKKMTPLAFLTVMLVLIIAYRTFRGFYIPLLVIIGTVVTAMGLMALFGVPMYLTSNIIPVILIAISVADAIHILGQYYEEYAKRPDASSKELTVATMKEMWKPITLTTVTDMFGFMAMGFTSYLPPLKMVGLFSSIGVLAALILSLLMVPCILVLLKPKPSRAYKTQNLQQTISPDIFGRWMVKLGNLVLSKSKAVIAFAILLLLVSGYGISKIVLDEASIEAFNTNTDIYKADRLINAKMNGSNSFDIMIETNNTEDLFEPENLRKIESLQNYLSKNQFVGGTNSIVDFIKQMNKSVNGNAPNHYKIPNDKDLIAQYFLLYSASGDPSDLEKYVDYDYRLANIRVNMNSGKYSASKSIIEPLNQYLESNFNSPSIKAKVAGWMNVFYYWLNGIGKSTALGVALALLLIWLVTSIGFKNAIAGLYAVIPVFFAVLVVFAIMGYTGIYMNTATSIFAAVALGIAVDFAVHIVDRLIYAIKDLKLPLEQALKQMYPTTGRALLFNFSAVALGFGINMVSVIPPFVDFGLLITACVVVSFLMSVSLLPALIKLFRPKFLTKYESF